MEGVKISVCGWSMRSLGLASREQMAKKRKVVGKLRDSCDVVCLTEARGTLADQLR